MTQRDRAAGDIDAATLGQMLDLAPSSVYRAIDGTLTGTAARAVEVISHGWALMTRAQRAAWLAALGVEAVHPERRGRPRKVTAA